jgi:hypothetical protein
MPLIVISVVLQFLCIVHMVRSRRPYWWAFIIMLGSFLGVAVYVLTQILPDLRDDPRARRAARGAIKAIDPTRDLRRLREELIRANTVQNKLNLGREMLALGEAFEAEGVFQSCLTGLNAHAPDILLALAQAQFAQDKIGDAHATLTRLIEHNPDFRSPDGHLLFARCLEGLGREPEALAEYQTLSPGFPGEEARFRYAKLLAATGQPAAAKALLSEALARARVAPPYYQKQEREWIEQGEALLKSL